MKKFKTVLLAVMAMLFFVGTVDAAMQHFTATVYKRDMTKYGMQGEPSDALIAITGITYKVTVYGATTSETILSGSGWGSPTTAKTNPVTAAVFATDGGRIDFYCDPTEATDTYVDLTVTDTTGGYTAKVIGFSSKMHSVVIDETPGIAHQGSIWFSCTSTGETNTGVSFVADTLISDVRPYVVTVASAKTISVGLLSSGTGGDFDGFRVGVLLTTAGYVADTGFITSGASVDYYPVSTYGAKLYKAVTGTGAFTSGKLKNGGRTFMGHVVTGSNTGALTYTCGSITSTGGGYIDYWFTRIR